MGLAGALVILTLILVAIFADLIAPYPIAERHLADRLTGPSLQYLMGTDQIGRDVLSRLIVGTRLSLLVGLAATVINAAVALLIGTTSGFLGGKTDLMVQRFVDAWMAFPGLLLLLTIMSIVGRGLWQIIIILGVAGGIGGSRIIRGAVLAIKENPYFEAAQAIGSPHTRTLVRHLVPNLLPPVIVIFSVSVGGNILAAASLSFLGFGIDSSAPDWGSMLSREGRQFMESAPWLAVWPGVLLTVTIFSFNMFGDALRDLIDPRLRGTMDGYPTSASPLPPTSNTPFTKFIGQSERSDIPSSRRRLTNVEFKENLDHRGRQRPTNCGRCHRRLSPRQDNSRCAASDRELGPASSELGTPRCRWQPSRPEQEDWGLRLPSQGSPLPEFKGRGWGPWLTRPNSM